MFDLPPRGRGAGSRARVAHDNACGRHRGGSAGHDRKGFGIVTTTASAHATRRDFLYVATGAVAAAGAAAAVWPLISQMNPDASTIAAGAPIEVDLAPVADGAMIKVFWRGKPIFVRHRTQKEIKEADDVKLSEPARSAARLGARQGRPRPVADRLRQLHPSRLHPARQPGPLWRLVLPVPRFGVRHLGPHPAGARSDQPSDSPLRVRLRHQDQDRLIVSRFSIHACAKFLSL